MKYQLSLPKDRAEYVLNYMGDSKVKKLSEENDVFQLEFTINKNIDLLELFHSGIHYGIDKFLK